MIEGVDFSSTAHANSPSVASLKAQGKRFVGRYAVNDKSPTGRGISFTEYQRYLASGIDVFLYWESSEGWMRGGFAAGTVAAVNAQTNIAAAGMPHDTPVYFACDYDASLGDQHLLDDCLRGCAEVLGFERVGLYAGYYPLLRAKQNRTARWFCQTLAWSDGLLMEGVHLYQYDIFNNYIDGTDVDLVRAYPENYGQANMTIEPKPQEPFPGFNHGLDSGTNQHSDGVTYWYLDSVMTVRSGRKAPGYDVHGKKVITLEENNKLRSAFTATIDKKKYLWDHNGIRYSQSPFSPRVSFLHLE